MCCGRLKKDAESTAGEGSDTYVSTVYRSSFFASLCAFYVKVVLKDESVFPYLRNALVFGPQESTLQVAFRVLGAALFLSGTPVRRLPP